VQNIKLHGNNRCEKKLISPQVSTEEIEKLLEPIKILLVEDEVVTAMDIKSSLVTLGYEVPAVISRGEDALQAIREFGPHLVLMDIALAGAMSGIDAALAIKKSSAIPIVFLTAHSDGDTVARAKTAEPYGYVPKPCSMATLMSTIEVTLYKAQVEAEHRKTQKALQESDERYRTLFTGAAEGIVIFTADGKVLEANESYLRISGLSSEVLRKKTITDLLAPSSVRVMRESVARVALGESVMFEVEHLHASGKVVPLEISANPIPFMGASCVQCFVRDIAERKVLEQQLRQAQKMEGIGQLASGIAHDFNNVLTTIIGYGDLLLTKVRDDDALSISVEHILDAASQAAALTKDLLLFGKRQLAVRVSVDMNQIVKNVSKFLTRIISEDIEFHADLDPEVMSILADEHQLQQVLINLATNARDAMPSGGIFRITTERVHVAKEVPSTHGTVRVGDHVLVTVSDTGVGMDQDTKDRIFDPFFAPQATGKGSGLGLAVVYGILKQHDACIQVESKPGAGTTYKIHFPLIQEKAKKVERPITVPTHGGTETILLAEDDDLLRNLISVVLEEAGYFVVSAKDGQDAVDKFLKHKDQIGLLILDLMMPKKNGKKVYDEVRALKPDIRVLFQSGYAPEYIYQKVMLDPGATVIFKPTAPKDLLKHIRAVLDAGIPAATDRSP